MSRVFHPYIPDRGREHQYTIDTTTTTIKSIENMFSVYIQGHQLTRDPWVTKEVWRQMTTLIHFYSLIMLIKPFYYTYELTGVIGRVDYQGL